MQTTFVQNYATKKTLAWATEKTNHEISIDNVRFSWFDEIEVKGFMLKDFSNDTVVSSKTILLNYDLRTLISDESMEIEEVHLESGVVNMIQHADSSDLNLNVFLKSLKKITGADTSKTKPILLDRIIVEDFAFRVTNEQTDEDKSKIDFSHLKLDIQLLEIIDFEMKKDSIGFDILQFLATDASERLTFKELSTRVGYTDKFLVLDDLTIRTENSIIGDSIHLAYNHPSALSSFSDSVSLFVNLKNSRIHPRDIQAMLGSNALKSPLSLSFEMTGKVGDLKVNNLRLDHGQSYINSEISLIGLPEINETFMDVSMKNSRIHSSDIGLYAGTDSNLIAGFEYADLSAVFTGFMNNFSTKATVITPLGTIHADMNVTIPEDKVLTSYTGHLELIEFDLGSLIGDTLLLQNASLKGRVIGRGITKEKATVLVDMTAADVGLKDYSYDSLTFKGYLAARHFYGHFRIDDPNCKISGRTNMDLRKAPEKLSLNAKIDTLFTKNLNLTQQDFFLQTRIDLKQTHLNLDSIVGRLKLSETLFQLDSTRTLNLDVVDIETKLDSTSRRVTLDAPGVKARLHGKFTFEGLAGFLVNELDDLSGYFEVDVDSTYFEVEPLKAELVTELVDVNQYINFFSPAVSISKGAILEASFEQKQFSDAIISLYAHADSIRYNEDTFLQNEVDVYASMDPKSDDVLASFLFSSHDQHWKSMPASERFITEGVWLDDKIELTTNIRQPDTDTKTKVNSEIILSNDSVEVKFKPSEIVALGNQWNFNPGNHIWLSKEGIFFEALEIDSDDKLASLSGLFSDTLNTNINLVSRNIDLSQFNSVLGLPIEGVFDADFSFYRRPGNPFQFEGNFNLYEFLYKDILIGNINGTSYWDEDKEGVRARVSVDRENFRTIELDGYYYPLKEEQFNFDVSFDQADFKMLEAFTEENLTDVKGAASGKIKLYGSGHEPVLSGTCEIEEGGFKVNYLQTNYEFGGKILFEKNKIGFEDFVLHDADGDPAIFRGNIRHEYFDEIMANLQVEALNFSFLNTTASDNNLYYGSAVASGDIFINGPLNDLIIKVNAKTEKGTKFYIPLSDSEEYEQAEFISFIDLSDTTSLARDAINVVEQNLGLTIDFDLEVTPDAYVELIFDIKTGDIIRGRGNGNLKLKLDKNGNFELYGPLTISEGAYNFTVPNFINKEFQVVPGGTIVWYGDPYTGSMELTATYLQKASFGTLLDDPSANEDASMSQKYPVIVVLELKGDMLAPSIEFDITLDESVSFAQSQEVSKLITQIKSDEQQLKRQVVSLLFFKKFSPLQSSFVGGGGGSGGSIGKSLSEFMTNQISYLATQLDENLEVEVDLTDLDKEGFNTFQLRLAYTFLDGRLKVTRGGDFYSATSENQNLVSDIIGDWSVEYMLTKDGKLRAKMFSQSNQNLRSNSSQQNIETGLSLRYIKSFNTFKDILSNTRSEAIQRKEEDEFDDNQTGSN
ncbi:MAG: hypothetical protein GY816_21300 [Cytophagales bacterium]|nr:hypothetical protein [Cytophagales bacterium]